LKWFFFFVRAGLWRANRPLTTSHPILGNESQQVIQEIGSRPKGWYVFLFISFFLRSGVGLPTSFSPLFSEADFLVWVNLLLRFDTRLCDDAL
jgi:hypothetical protein